MGRKNSEGLSDETKRVIGRRQRRKRRGEKGSRYQISLNPQEDEAELRTQETGLVTPAGRSRKESSSPDSRGREETAQLFLPLPRPRDEHE
ncbi:hypothetical protein R1sor_017587 [Riccia sorocarpa]|uniref:Uncharacterized protein n=1 Tax=Riccia sorocarpa TaxID=122646 RepID=A0ABD3IAW1_9MARC